MTNTTIRRARPHDAEILTDLGRLTFSQTFQHLYPPEDLSAFLASSYSVEKISAELIDPDTAVWLVEDDGEAIGYAVAGACSLPHPLVTPACGELKRLYLLQDRRGGGVGSRLMSTTLDWLERAGRRRIWIGVWSENLGAQRLYERHGFAKVGEYGFKVGQTTDHEFILRRG
jgi:ribosomal protein S18 acetylase RimI-like enzyme